MKSKKMFTETVEFQILHRLSDLVDGIAHDTHFRVLGLLGINPIELNAKLSEEQKIIEKMSTSIILSSIGKESIQVFDDEQIKVLEKALKIVIQKELNILSVIDFYPDESKKLVVKRAQWENKFEKASKNIIALAKGEKFIYDNKDDAPKPKL